MHTQVCVFLHINKNKINKKSMQYRLQLNALLCYNLINSASKNLAGALKFIYINVNCALLCTHKLHFHTLCSLPHLIVRIYNFIQGNDKEKGKGCICSFKLLKLIFFKV